MTKKLVTPMEAFFPDNRIYEYFLQRLRLVASENTRVLRVHEIRDVPDSPDGLPCIEVVIRILGLKIRNPATGVPMLSTDWLKEHFEGQPSQRACLDAFAEYLKESIPANHPEAHLKSKFNHYRDGAPGDLPARADLDVWREELVRHLAAAKKWLRERQKSNQTFSKGDKAKFLDAISLPIFWWSKYVRKGLLSIEQIAHSSPRRMAMEILALKFGKSYEAIKLRFRKI